MLHNFAEAIRDLQRSYRDAVKPYRPELYYMRGPGPACRAKRAGRATPTGPTSLDTLSVLPKFVKAHA